MLSSQSEPRIPRLQPRGGVKSIVDTGYAAITGTRHKPIVRLRPRTVEQRSFASKAYRSRYVKTRDWYVCTEVSETFFDRLDRLGYQVAVDPALDASKDQLIRPYAELAGNGRDLLVHPRLGGFDRAMELAGWASTWDRSRQAIVMPLLDASRPGIEYAPDVAAAYDAAMAKDPRQEAFADLAATAAAAITFDDIDGGEQLASALSTYGCELFAHQGPGAVAAVLGHGLVADPPGVGKSQTATAAAYLARAQRIVVVCMPVLVPNWQREIAMSGLEAKPAAYRAGRKPPKDLGRFVVVPDSLLSKPEILQRLIDWRPDMMIVDEAHRMKNRAAKRTAAALDLSVHVDRPIALTGTPVVSGPHELVPILELTGHLGPVFGGPSAFLEAYCTRNRFGKFAPRRRALPRLHELLMSECMVRRRKADVLPFLPPRLIAPLLLEVPTTAYRTALKETVAAIAERFVALAADGDDGECLGEEEAAEFLRANSAQYLAPLRIAAAMLKVKPCADAAEEHVQGGGGPLVICGHHREPLDALVVELAERGISAQTLLGGMAPGKRQRLIDDFQAGMVPVLIASIQAAGVGLTLTRSNRAVFVEADWTPALVSQAVDRCHRIGQTEPVLAQVLVALGTLDEHVQGVLTAKETVSGAVHGDAQDEVSVLTGDFVTPKALVDELVDDALVSIGRSTTLGRG